MHHPKPTSYGVVRVATMDEPRPRGEETLFCLKLNSRTSPKMSNPGSYLYLGRQGLRFGWIDHLLIELLPAPAPEREAALPAAKTPR
jgi:hypothetical protein